MFLLLRFAGTALHFRPGVVVGGADISHECGKERGVGYFLEPLCLLSLVSKQVCLLLTHQAHICRVCGW